jgi:rhodanese-related sulfurtransferase
LRRLFAAITWLSLVSALAAGSVVCSRTSPRSHPETSDLRSVLDEYLRRLPAGYGVITATDLEERIRRSTPVILDVRETKEAAAGCIPGAVNIPTRTLLKNLDKLPSKDQPITLTCGSGHRSALAMEALQLLGYRNVTSLAGGFNGWKAAGLPVAARPAPDLPAAKSPNVDNRLVSILNSYLGNLPDTWNTITPGALKDLIEISQPFQLDVREATDRTAAAHIPGSFSIPLRSLIGNLDKLPLDKNAILVLESSTGHEGSVALLALGLLGYTNSRSLAGGLAGWTKAGFPLAYD